MPREQVECFMKQSIHDSDKIHAQQSCTYYSVVNVNKKNYPFLSSYEQEQTWTLTRTMSHNHKRYQSSIENIHLTVPISPLKTKHIDDENIKIKNDRSMSLLPSNSSSRSSLGSSCTNVNQTIHQKQQQEQKISPIKTVVIDNSNSNIRKSRPLSKPMRIVHADGEFIVRV